MTTAINQAGFIPQFEIRHCVKLAREYADLQQSELAEITGMARSAIAHIESGKSIPRKSSINLIAMATGVDRVWLETGNTPAGDSGGGSVVRHQGLEPRTHWLVAA